MSSVLVRGLCFLSAEGSRGRGRWGQTAAGGGCTRVSESRSRVRGNRKRLEQRQDTEPHLCYAVRQVGNVLGMCPVQMYSHPCRECPQMIVIPASHVTCGSRQEGVDCQALHGVRLSYLSYKNNSNGWDDGVTGSSPPSTTRSSRAVGVCSLSSTTAGWLGGGGVVVGWPQPLVRRSLSRGCHSDSTGSCRRSGSCC